MTMMLYPLSTIICGICGYAIASAVLPDTAAIGVGIVAATVGLIIHWYSPLPAHNGGMGLGTPERQQWGFTSEPADDTEDKS